MLDCRTTTISASALSARSSRPCVDENDPVCSRAAQYPTTRELGRDYIRSLPQRDDLGETARRLLGARPPVLAAQRVRIGAPTPTA